MHLRQTLAATIPRFLLIASSCIVLACHSATNHTSNPPTIAIPTVAPAHISAPTSDFAFPQGGLRLEYLFEPDFDAPPDALSRARDVLQKRLDAVEARARVAMKDNHIVVDLLGTTSEKMESIRDQLAVGKLEFREVEDSLVRTDKLSPGMLELPAIMLDGSTKMVRLRAGGMGQEHVGDAELQVNDWGVAVVVRFNEAGAEAFERLTQNNLNKPIAIVVGAKIITMPIVKAPITGGRVQITMGGPDLDKQHAEAQALVRALKAGVLPGKLVLESEYLVKPDAE